MLLHTFLLADNAITWQSTAVALALCLMVAGIMITAIIKYPISGVLQIWAALGTLVGILTGVCGGYFFNKQLTDGKIAELETTKTYLAAQLKASNSENERITKANPPADTSTETEGTARTIDGGNLSPNVPLPPATGKILDDTPIQIVPTEPK